MDFNNTMEDSLQGVENAGMVNISTDYFIRWVTLIMCTITVGAQFYHTVIKEIWKKKCRTDIDSYYFAPNLILIANAIGLFVIEFFYVVRCIKLPELDDPEIMYSEILTMVSIALIFQILRFPSSKDVNAGFSSMLHMAAALHVFTRNRDYFAVAASFTAMVIGVLKSPRLWRLKTE